MALSIAIKRRDPHQAVHPFFRFAIPISKGTHDTERYVFNPGDISLQKLHRFYFPPSLRCPFLIHPEEHLRPITRFGSSCPSINA